MCLWRLLIPWGYVVKNKVEDYSTGVPNDLAAIAGAYVRGE